MPDIEIILAACLALFLGGFVKGAIGFGMPLVATPIMLFYLPLTAIISLIIFPVFVSNLQQCWYTRASAGILRVVWPMIVMNVAVLVLGSHLIVSMDGNAIRVIIGCLIIFHAILTELPFEPRIGSSNTPLIAGITGALSGAIGSVSSFFSFPGVQLLHSMRLQPSAFVFATGAFVVTGFTALWVGILLYDAAPINNLAYSLAAVVPVVAGLWVGNRVRDGIGSKQFRRLVSTVLILVGISLIMRSL